MRLSSSAIIASIDMTTSLLMRLVCDSACCASVSTACSTADLASSDLGLNSLFRSDANSLPWYSMPCSADCWVSVSSAMMSLRIGSLGLLGLARLGQGLEQRLVLDH